MSKSRHKGTRLRTWREAAGLTVREAADLADVDDAVWHGFESGARRVTAAMRVRISRRLGGRIRDMFDAEPVEALAVEGPVADDAQANG